ncbi:LuxR family transcriptional regulator [Conexibacter sp. CPCC 206217]|uniref:helix-turn-helix transcriptional regulator n=1 Tax=Conexibacter sp. CPCC 206217 TaxID=3064574 RepID=UPI00271F9D5A|nr:LuxR family transcriptional regulator [Conexibacter sp. CPCC 206217]MDO8212370.1 AAA family ATPase [Conexibacter sp. CPCC 206217]
MRADLRPAATSDPLLGRDLELDALVELLDGARRGEGRHLVLEGAAGIGKTRLLREIDAVARRSGLRVLSARADPLATEVAFGIALELVEPLADVTGAERAELFAGAARLIEPLLSPGRPLAHADAAQQFAHGAYRLLANAAARQPLLVVVDDLQWVDAGSLRVLAHLAARLEGQPIAVAAALRAGEPPADPAGLERFRFEPAATVVRPRPLPLRDIARLAAAAGLAAAPDTFLTACVEVTSGNPLLLKALLSDVATRGELGEAAVELAAGGAAGGGPAGAAGVGGAADLGGVLAIARYVQAQLGRLPPLAGELALAAAVLGDGASLRQAARLCGADLDRAAAAADRLLEAGVLAQVEPLAFAHPVVRASLHDHLEPASRGRLHAAAARQLAADRADSERIAAHLMRALPARDPQAVELLHAAARQARARAVPESAIAYLRRALEEPPPDWQLAETLLELGRAEAAAGLPDAAETLTRALDLLDTPRERAEALLWIGRTRFAGGALLEAAKAFDRGLDVLDAAGVIGTAASAGARPAAADAILAELQTELRAGYISAARFETSLRPEAQRRLAPLLETMADGTTRGERALLAEVALEQGIRCAPPQQAIALALRAWAHGRVLDELDAQGIVLSQIAATLTWSDALDESEQVLDAAVAHAERNGAAHQLATAAYLRAWPHYYCGRLAAADADARVALATPGWKMYEPSARAVIALVAIERGDVVEADTALDVPDAAEKWAGSIPYAMLLEAQGRLALIRGDGRAAAQAFEACGALISAMDTGHPFCPWRSQAALAHLQEGDRERAVELAQEEVALARAIGLARPLGASLRAAGVVAGGEAGLALLRESAAALADSPARLERARALVELGAALRRASAVDDARATNGADAAPATGAVDGARATSRADDARASLREGLALATEIGATLLAERAAAELRATGARTRRVATAGVAALTPSERRIARLAALGLTNREIAREAVIVPKTVQFHLANAYRKLGISGRDELADALAADPAG